MLSPPTRLLTLALAVIATTFAYADDSKLAYRQSIDAEIRAGFKRAKVSPVGPADDATFLRRVFLDLVGTIPTDAEARAFLTDKDAKKRDKLINKLLDDPRFAGHQADTWDLVLFGRRANGNDATRKRDTFKDWISDKFRKNEPVDHWVRELLLGEKEGTDLFYVQYRNQPEDATEGVSRIFLGMQLQCARCHDHPYEVWTQRDFYGMAGFFVRLVVQDGGASKAKGRFRIQERASGEVLFAGSVKDARPGKKGEPVPAKFLGGDVVKDPPFPKDFKEVDYRTSKNLPKPPFSRKEKLADWIVAKENPYFARAIVNRIWGQFMGRGFVHPVDDLSEKHTPSHPDLLKGLTEQFVANKYDLKWLIREIVSSDSYQLSAKGDDSTTRDALPKWYQRARVRPLTAEEMVASLGTATGYVRAGGKMTNNGPEYFLRFFGTPTNGLGEFQGALSEHLFMNNSSNVKEMIRRRKGNLADNLATSSESWDKRVDQLFLAVLTRQPNDAERKAFVAHLTSDAKKQDSLIEEAIWALVSGAEFRFNR